MGAEASGRVATGNPGGVLAAQTTANGHAFMSTQSGVSPVPSQGGIPSTMATTAAAAAIGPAITGGANTPVTKPTTANSVSNRGRAKRNFIQTTSDLTARIQAVILECWL